MSYEKELETHYCVQRCCHDNYVEEDSRAQTFIDQEPGQGGAGRARHHGVLQGGCEEVQQECEQSQ
jgi:hypothetical protein